TNTGLRMNSTPSHAGADARQRAQARDSAEALFARKPPPEEHFTDVSPSPEPVRKPRVLSAAPATERVPASAGERSAHTKKKPRGLSAVKAADSEIQSGVPKKSRIPCSDVARIRTWIRYGMKPDEIAGMYGIGLDELRE